MTDTEKEFVTEDAVPNDTELRRGKLQDNVDEKVRRLPDRVALLFSDVDIWHQNGFLDSGGQRPDWETLIERDSNQASDDETTSGARQPAGAPLMEEFGQQLGHLAAQLTHATSGVNQEQAHWNLVWGFISGVGSVDYDRNRFQSDCIDCLSERKQAEESAQAEGRQALMKSVNPLIEAFQNESDRIRNQLKAQDIDPDEWLVHAVREKIGADLGIQNVNAVPLATESDSTDDVITQERVAKAVEDHRLLEKRKLVQFADQDYQEIDDIEWSGVGATEVYEALTPDRPISTSTIIENIETANVAPNQVAKLGRYLAGADAIRGDQREGPPVVNLEEDGEEHLTTWKWTLTPYGQVLREIPPTSEEPPDLRTLGEARPLTNLSESTVTAALESVRSHLPD